MKSTRRLIGFLYSTSCCLSHSLSLSPVALALVHPTHQLEGFIVLYRYLIRAFQHHQTLDLKADKQRH